MLSCSNRKLFRSRVGALIKNPMAVNTSEYESDLQSILNLEGFRAASIQIRSLPSYAPTPLWQLSGLARLAGVDSIWYKDESVRFDLGSFKALGTVYALFQVLAAEVVKRTNQLNVSAIEILSGKYAPITSGITVTAPTNGNYGIALAWASRLFGCDSVIYFPNHTSWTYEEAITSLGAKVVRVGKTYDASSRQCATDAKRFGWLIVSDAAYLGYTDIPRYVMEGYSLIADEVWEVLKVTPTHLFIQAGIGGLAAAICAFFWAKLGSKRPIMVVVEPDKAACLKRSIEARKMTSIESELLDTVMTGLACGEPSLLAFKILSKGGHFFMTIPDQAALETMCFLANPVGSDPPIVGGPSGVSGLAGFLSAIQNARARAITGLNHTSRIIVFGSEGSTDHDFYWRIVGRSAKQVLAGQYHGIR